MGENSRGTGAARNSLDGHVYLYVWSAQIKSSLTFSLEKLLREEEGLFRFSADGTQKKGGREKKKGPNFAF